MIGCSVNNSIIFQGELFLWCLQLETSSLRLFSIAIWGFDIIKYFSHRAMLSMSPRDYFSSLDENDEMESSKFYNYDTNLNLVNSAKRYRSLR